MQSVAVQYFQMKPEDSPRIKLSGQSILIASHIRDYILQLLANDIQFAPFYLVSLETKYSMEYEVLSGDKTIKIRIGGVVDRIDRTSDGLRIIDYKTGRNLKLDFKEWSQLVDRNYYDRRKEIFQTLIYSDILDRSGIEEPIYPIIYKLDDLFQEEFVPNVIFQGEKLIFQRVASEFGTVFAEVLSEMFAVGSSYEQTKDLQKCSYCSYNKICRR